MKVKRIVTNIEARDPAAMHHFYGQLLGLEVLMDQGWIITFGHAAFPLGGWLELCASEGGSGTPVPGLSVEVDDLEEAYRRMTNAGIEIEYGPVNEPWGVRRFFVRDPSGKLVNILSHL